MEYKNKINEYLTNVYEVTIDKTILEEVLKELEEYKYTKYNIGYIHKSNATSIIPSIATKQIIKRLHETNRKAEIIDESVKLTKNPKDCYEYIYKYQTYPELYNCVALLLKKKKIEDCHEYAYETGTLNVFYAIAHKDQLVIEHLLSYFNSKELKTPSERLTINEENSKLIELEESSNSNFDYKGLYKLYKKALTGVNFKLTGQLRKTENNKTIDGLVLVKTKINNNK